MVVDAGEIEVNAGLEDLLVPKVDGRVGKLVPGDDSVWGCIEARFGGVDMQ